MPPYQFFKRQAQSSNQPVGCDFYNAGRSGRAGGMQTMRAPHHIRRFVIRHGNEIYCLLRDTAIIAGLMWLCWMFSRWLVYSSPVVFS